jgi:hypothetical protein
VFYDGPTEKIQLTESFNYRIVALGYRAGYKENIAVHNARAETLIKVDGKFF